MDGCGVVADSFPPSFSAATTMPAGGTSVSAESEGAFKVKSGEGGGRPDCRELEQDMFSPRATGSQSACNRPRV